MSFKTSLILLLVVLAGFFFVGELDYRQQFENVDLINNGSRP